MIFLFSFVVSAYPTKKGSEDPVLTNTSLAPVTKQAPNTAIPSKEKLPKFQALADWLYANNLVHLRLKNLS